MRSAKLESDPNATRQHGARLRSRAEPKIVNRRGLVTGEIRAIVPN